MLCDIWGKAERATQPTDDSLIRETVPGVGRKFLQQASGDLGDRRRSLPRSRCRFELWIKNVFDRRGISQ
jgi:hypothetical protein